MLEKEIKILDVNVIELQEKLESMGAERTFIGFIHDVYYDFPDDGSHKMEENKRLFRVRQKWETHLYTIKRKRNKKSEWGEKWFKIADEGEREITDVDSFRKVLEKYWMTQTREKKKHRMSYKLNGLEFDIDQYEWIPALLEIEAHTTEEITEYITILGLESHEKNDYGSRKLFKHYGKEYLNL